MCASGNSPRTIAALMVGDQNRLVFQKFCEQAISVTPEKFVTHVRYSPLQGIIVLFILNSPIL